MVEQNPYGGNMAGSNTYAPYQEGNPKRIKLSDVDKYTLDDYGLNVGAVKEQLLGINVVDPVTGKTLGDAYYKRAINSAVASVEKKLDIKILPQKKVESKDFYPSDFSAHNYIRTRNRPILQVEEFSMRVNGQPIIQYPSGWWKVNSLGGSISLMPTLGAAMPGYGSYTGNYGADYFMGNMYQSAPLLGAPVMNNRTTTSPSLFQIGYIAGMLPQAREGVEEDWEMPQDLQFLILKQAAKDVLEQFGRLLIGAGIASRGLSVDGISENIVTTQSAMYGGAAADIIQLNQDIDNLMSGLKAKYMQRVGII